MRGQQNGLPGARGLSHLARLSLLALIVLASRGLARAEPIEAKVREVLSGNEIELEGGQRVRYIGVQVPKLDHGYASVRSVARRARAENRRLVEGRAVRIETDVAPRDRRGRTLAYVYVGDRCVNGELIRLGWAMAEKTSTNTTHRDEFQRLEREAKAFGRGIWGSEAEWGLDKKLDRRRGTTPKDLAPTPAGP
ncbi:MAG: thermonuclease family protein [Myxococcales bacterium]|nr:thermonuclease family protein [Myxococcales bacterium]